VDRGGSASDLPPSRARDDAVEYGYASVLSQKCQEEVNAGVTSPIGAGRQRSAVEVDRATTSPHHELFRCRQGSRRRR